MTRCAILLALLIQKAETSRSDVDDKCLIQAVNATRDHHRMHDGSSKAFAEVLSSKIGPSLTPPNPQLKLLLTSSGLMPDSARTQLEAYKNLVESAEGNAILYLLDPKLLTLQFTALHSDPEKSNDEKFVAYHRNPDEPGGAPVLDEAGRLVMRTQAELLMDRYGDSTAGHASADYALRHAGHYSNGHLEILTQGKSDTPIFLSYLWDEGQNANGIPQYSIFVMRGYYRGGVFTAQKVSGEDFSESDYEMLHYPRNNESDRFGKVSPSEFANIVSTVKTIMGCGGSTFRAIQALSPFAIDSAGMKLEYSNPYGRVILDRVKSGKAVYVGQSATSVALSFFVGPLTTDPVLLTSSKSDLVKVRQLEDDEGVNVTQWLLPGIGDYLGMPYQLLLRPHLKFDPHTLSFGENILNLERVSRLVKEKKMEESLITHSIYAAVLADYNYTLGQSDLLEISGGHVLYHVGYSDEVDIVPDNDRAQLLNRYAPVWAPEKGVLQRQPPGNSPGGWVFQWTPKAGEVFAAGPLAKQQFRIYASSSGPFSKSNTA